FNKSLEELTISEVSFLAGLPKAPNAYHPLRNADAAIGRRNYVLKRMLEDGYISDDEFAAARQLRIEVKGRNRDEFVEAPFFAEEVRREISEKYGEDVLYRGGLSVRTTLDPRLQKFGAQALRGGLISYDRRHGWRGPIAQIKPTVDWLQELMRIPLPTAMPDWGLAAVLEIDDASGAIIGLTDGKKGHIPLSDLTWARAWRDGQKLGPEVNKVSEVLTVGDVILVEELLSEDRNTEK
ncbi:uncharacterized protein METZ01_LOCUS492580, partial [marine metagenome]